MSKKIISLLLCVLLVFSFVGANAYYEPGPRYYDMTKEDSIESNGVTLNGTTITVSGEGSVTYDYYISFDTSSIEVIYEQGSEGTVTIEPENMAAQTLELTATDVSVTYTLPTYQESGDRVLNVSFSGEMTISAIRLHQKKQPFSVSESRMSIQVLPDLTDNEWAIHTAVLIKDDASVIIVNGARRYIDEHDVTQKPLVIDGTTYLPIKPLARALEYYFENMPDKNYYLLRNDQTTYESRDGVVTKQIGHGEKTVVNAPAKVIDGEVFLPVRFYAEELGKYVFYKDGLIVIEDSKHLGTDILENYSYYNFVLKTFEPFTQEKIAGNTYYVSQQEGASDCNPGTIDAPFRTLAKAGAVAQAGDTVIIREGTYRETFAPQNDGTATSPIIFKAYEGENPVITTTEEVSDFVDMGDGTFAASVNWDLGRGKNQVFHNSNGDSFFNTECIIEARYPNSPGIVTSEDNPLSPLYPVTGDFFIPDDNDYLVTSDTLLNQTEDDYWKGAIYVSMHGYGWGLCTGIVGSSTKGSMTITETSTKTFEWYKGKQSNKMDWGYLSGHRNCMDLPGEWVMEDNILFIIPPEGETADSLKVEVKQRQLAADLSGRKFVQLRGIDIFGGSILMDTTEMCMLDDIDAKYISHFTYHVDKRDGYIDDWTDEAIAAGDGAILRGELGFFINGTDNYVINSRLDHSAAAALVLAGKYDYVENNIISNTGYAGVYISGITLTTEPHKPATTPRGGGLIVNNTSYNAGRSVIHMNTPENDKFGGYWRSPYLPMEVAYNDFHDGILFSLDTGITYEYEMVAQSHRNQTEMHHNYVYYTVDETNPYSMGIYHDGGTVGFNTHDNIVFCTKPGVVITASYVTESGHSQNAAVYSWRNMTLKNEAVEGGPTNLTTEQFPYGQPFYAGTWQENDKFMRNFDSEADTAEIFFANDDNVSLYNGAEYDEDGRAVLDKSGEYIEIKNIDLTETGKNVASIYFKTGSAPYAGFPGVEIGFGESAETAMYAVGGLNSRAADDDELSMYDVSFPAKAGVTNMYIRSNTKVKLVLDSFVLRLNARTSAGHDGALVWGGSYDRISKATAAEKPSAVVDAELGGSHVKGTWATSEIVYEDVTIPEDAKYFWYCTHTAAPYDGQNVKFRYYIEGAPSEIVFAEDIVPNNGWSYKGDRQYFPLPDNFPKETLDILVEFTLNGCTDFYGFGFVSELPEGN